MKLFLLAFLVFTGDVVNAQTTSNKVTADKIVASIGDHIILQSEIDEYLAQAKLEGGAATSLNHCSYLEQALLFKLLVMSAENDSLLLPEETIEATVNERMNWLRNGQNNMDPARTAEIKSLLQQSVREYHLAEAMKEKIRSHIRTTPTEVQAYYENISENALPTYGTSMELEQLLIAPEIPAALDQYITGEMNNYKKQLAISPSSFCRLANQLQGDPKTGQECSSYFINRNDHTIDPVIRNTAFRLKPNEISDVVRSSYRFHLLQLIEKNGEEAVVRQITRVPAITGDLLQTATTKLDSIRTAIVNGKLDFRQALLKYSTEKNIPAFISSKDGSSFITLDELDSKTGSIVYTLKPGEYSAVHTTVDYGKTMVRLLYLKSVKAAHRMNLGMIMIRLRNLHLQQSRHLHLNNGIRPGCNIFI